MVEMTKKYKIGTRRFGLINWVGAWTLYKKESLRFLIVWVQTIFSPLISSLLFLLVLSLAIGTDRGEMLGVSFISFLAPGLIAMQVIQQSFSHSSSSFMIGKIQGNIVDLLYAPLSAAEVTIAGLWAEKFDHMASVTNFVIIPLSFLSGTFYTTDKLPDFLQTISKANPFFYMIDGFRYCFIGTSDGSIFVGITYLTILSLLSWFTAYYLYKKGYKIKS